MGDRIKKNTIMIYIFDFKLILQFSSKKSTICLKLKQFNPLHTLLSILFMLFSFFRALGT